MTHYMNLHPQPFASIKSGRKTVEMRLYDQKRKLINIGDNICFTNNQTQETITAQVIAVKVFESFAQLYNAYDKISIGYNENETANPCDMEQYYTKEQMLENGVCAIEIKLIN